jgi:hypothetical protein
MTTNCWVCKSPIGEDDLRVRCVRCEMHMCEGCASDKSRWCMNTSVCIFAKKKEATVMTEITSTGKCAVCKSKILEGSISCPKCDTAHCEGCWDGKCSVYGCESSIRTPASAPPLPTIQNFFEAAAFVVLIVTLGIFGSAMVIIFALNPRVELKVKSDEIVILELDNLTKVFEPGHSYLYYDGGAKLTHYKWRGKINFSTLVTLKSGVKANVSVRTHYDLPVDEQKILRFHFDSKSAINGDLITKMILDSILQFASQTEEASRLSAITAYDVSWKSVRYGIDFYHWNINIEPVISMTEVDIDKATSYHMARQLRGNVCTRSVASSFTLDPGCGK